MKRLLVLLVFLLTSPALCAKVKIPDRDYSSAWRAYLNSRADLLPEQEFPFQHCFERSAKQYNLPLSLLLALARGESDFQPKVRSSANAYGLMQILWPGTAKHLGIHSLEELRKPCVNVDGGARYLKELLQHFDGDLHLALAAYNYGPSRIEKNKQSIPTGANWYSGYIYQHLQYVIADSKKYSGFKPPKRYQDENKLEINVFSKAYQAIYFVKAMRLRAPRVRIDAFRKSKGVYPVRVLYASKAELESSRRTLRQMGIRF